MREKRLLSIGGVNPADIYQVYRRSKGKMRKPEMVEKGVGIWKGKLEPSYRYSLFSGEGGVECLRRELNQESIYAESPRGYQLHFKEAVIYSRHKFVITIWSTTVDLKTVAELVSSVKSKYRLFYGGTVYRRGNRIVLESAIFGDDVKVYAGTVQEFVNEIRQHGVYAKTSLVRVR